jgi:deazaflavin-dependent oxidoreductase (nitroreductase family)
MARQDASHLYGAEHVRAYRETDGELGHDWRRGSPVLLLTTIGRRSGEPRTTPLIYGRSGDDYLIVASHGGSPEPPDWFQNLSEHPEREIPVVVLERRA